MYKPQHRIQDPSWLSPDSFARFSQAVIPHQAFIPMTQQASFVAVHAHISSLPYSFSLSSKTLLFIHTSKSSSFGKPSLASPELVPPPGIPSAIVLIRESLVTWVCLLAITFVYLSSPPSSPPTMLWDPWGQSQVLIHLYLWSIALGLSHSRVWKTLNE